MTESTDDMGNWLEGCLARIPDARVAVFGDFCIDAYWHIDEDDNEVSIETSLPVRRVREQRYSLGGAGNVVANLRDLGVRRVSAVGMTSDDVFGHHMRSLLGQLGVNTEGRSLAEGRSLGRSLGSLAWGAWGQAFISMTALLLFRGVTASAMVHLWPR